MAAVSGTLSGFDPSAFNISMSGFSNDTTGAGPSNWSVSETPDGGGSDIYLNFSAVPEPSSVALVALGLAGVLMRRSRRNVA